MPPVVPGQAFEVKTLFTNRSAIAVTSPTIALTAQRGWIVTTQGADSGPRGSERADCARRSPSRHRTTRQLTRPHFTRTSIQEPRYTVADRTQLHRPSADAVLSAIVRYEVDGVPVELRVPVTRLEPNLPYGADIRVLAVVPAIAVTVSPSRAVAMPLRIGARQDDHAPRGSGEQPRRRPRGRCAATAGGMDGVSPVAALPVRARWRARGLRVHRLGAVRRGPRVHDRGGRDRRWPRVSRGLRRHPASRPRDALPLSPGVGAASKAWTSRSRAG